jgi:hypothetical protein
MTTNGKVKPDFWNEISLDETPASGWQRLTVDSVDTVKTGNDYSWLGDQIQIQLRCLVTEGKFVGTSANCTLRVGGSEGTTRDGRAFTISEGDSLNTALARIGRILNCQETGHWPDLDRPTELLSEAKLQSVAESMQGSTFFGQLSTNDNGYTNVGNGKTHVRAISNPPEVFATAVPDDFSA